MTPVTHERIQKRTVYLNVRLFHCPTLVLFTGRGHTITQALHVYQCAVASYVGLIVSESGFWAISAVPFVVFGVC